jgi:hypothetical protein
MRSVPAAANKSFVPFFVSSIVFVILNFNFHFQYLSVPVISFCLSPSSIIPVIASARSNPVLSPSIVPVTLLALQTRPSSLRLSYLTVPLQTLP